MQVGIILAQFDYILVGAGSAGCVLANRLSANPEKTVCLLEAGGNHLSPMLHIPAGWATNFNNPRVDWGYSTQPEPELNDREVYWPRGKVLGGSSAINGMIYIRGVPRDFEDWSQAGAVGWGWEDVLPYFVQAERQQTHRDDLHGNDGPLHVEDVRDKRPIHEVFLDAMQSSGIPANPDFNGQDQAGCGYYQFTQHNGRRWSTASAYLDPIRARKNLTVITGATASQIQFEGKKATGVTYDRKGKSSSVTGGQVVLCGGSINTPQLLELSGVGDGERLHTLGIPVIHNSPEVGENLQDHVLTKVVYKTHPDQSINREVQGWRLLPTAMKWFFTRRGPLTTGSAPVGGFWYTQEGLDVPDVQIHYASGATLYNNQGRIRAMNVPAMTAVVNQNRPESRGSLHITNTDAKVAPEIRANYLSTDNDRQCLIRGIRMLLNIFDQTPLQGYLEGRLSPGPEIDPSNDDEILEYIRNDASTTYHPTSTCAIGKVVDPNLKVMGVEGLSIADASVMPFVVSGNTNAAAIMIAEKAADLLQK
ncbi:MAG: choline dehydrogenase [Pseudomonadales bacterium]|nr:choline dehydrogenase [Pseudomonadales bacterium]